MDQRAETELGRLVLRGTIDATLGLAGETYLALWRGYVMSIGGPAAVGVGGGHGFTCDGCESEEQRRWCRCSFRARVFLEAQAVLQPMVRWAVARTVIHGMPSLPWQEELLRMGLGALAQHFGLTGRGRVVVSRNSASDSVPHGEAPRTTPGL